VHGSLCMPSPNVQLYTVKGSHIHQVTSSIMSCFTDMHAITPIGADIAQLKEFQVTEFQSHSDLFLQKVIESKEKHF
jgi:hypothetical protein